MASLLNGPVDDLVHRVVNENQGQWADRLGGPPSQVRTLPRAAGQGRPQRRATRTNPAVHVNVTDASVHGELCAAPLPGLGADSRRATKAAAWRAIPPSTSTLWDTDVVAVGAHESPPLHRSIVLSPSSGLIADKESPAMRWRGCRRRPPRRRRGARPWCRTRNVPCSRVFAALLERHHKPPAHAKLEPSPPPGEWCFCICPLGPALVIAPSHDGVRRPRGSERPPRPGRPKGPTVPAAQSVRR